MKNVLIGILVFIVALLAFVILKNDLFSKKDNSKVDSTIVVQKIQKVLKLVTVE